MILTVLSSSCISIFCGQCSLASLKLVRGTLISEAHSCALISEVVALLKRILVLPSSKLGSEWSFSATRFLKTYLQATMKQKQFSDLLLLHVHKDNTESFPCIEVVKSFVDNSEHCLCIGKMAIVGLFEVVKPWWEG